MTVPAHDHASAEPGATRAVVGLSVDRVLELVAVFMIAASLVGLGAALAEAFQAPQVLLVSLILTGAYAYKSRRRDPFPGQAKPRWAHLLLLILVGLFFRLPAYNYVLGGQDEGLYTNIAQHIEHTGGLAAHDRVMQKLEGSEYLQRYLHDNRIREGSSPTLYLLGVYAREPGTTNLVFQFYYLFPVWMAIFGGILGTTAAVYALTLFAVLSIVFFYRIALLITRSHSTALLAGGLLALNPLHAFFSKFPVTEVPTLAFSLMGFTLLTAYWSVDVPARRSRWLWLSALAFLCLFLTRISGLMYMPFILVMAMVTLVCDEDASRRRAIQWWAIGAVVAYFASVVYGLHWSPYYSRDQYFTSLEPLFGAHWPIVVAFLVVLGILAWAGCWARARQPKRRDSLVSWVVRPVDRWLGLIVASALVMCLVKVYLLGWTDYYSASDVVLRFHLSEKGWWSASASSLWALFVFVGPLMLLGFVAVAVRRQVDPRLAFLRLFVVGFFVFAVVINWVTWYSPYYARYLLSELVPYLILLVVFAWRAMEGRRARTLLSLVLIVSLVYSVVVSAAQIGKNEDEGAYSALARLTRPVDPDDVILLDTLARPPNTNLVKTPLVYTFHHDVVTVGDQALSNKGYIAKLRSIYNDVFLISAYPAAPAGFVRVDSVRFEPMTYEHNHSFPRRLVPQANVLLYLYRLDSTRVSLGEILSFAKGEPWGAWLQSGWSVPESWGVWSDANHAELAIDIPRLASEGAKSADSSEGLVLRLHTNVYVNAAHPVQRIVAYVGGKQVAEYTVRYPAAPLTMDIPIRPVPSGSPAKVRIGFSLPDAVSPDRLGLGGDRRALAIGLTSAQFLPAAEAKSH